MKITEIKKIAAAPFGAGQISHNPREYFDCNCKPSDFDGRAEVAEIITDSGASIHVYSIAGRYGIKITYKNGTVIYSRKLFINTVSPEALAVEAERAANEIKNAMHPEKTRLAQMRMNEGITQKELAKMTGIHFVTICRYETGETDIRRASFDTVDKLATALQCSVYDIV